jgi:signal peptidase I
MKPTIVEGDRIFVNKLAYDLKIPYTTWHVAEWGNPSRGDIVVFYSPADNKRLVKRVIGLPGDEIAMRDNVLFINGEQLKYESADDAVNRINLDQYCIIEDLSGRKHPVMITIFHSSMRSFSTITVPEGYYFMMGDNRDNSADSRYFGFVERKRIVGQAKFIVISLDKKRKYQPRWGRFFTELS